MASKQRHANRLTIVTIGRGDRGGAAKVYQLRFFAKKFDRRDDHDLHEDLHEAMELSICQAGWTTLFNHQRTADSKVKSIVEGGEPMMHWNAGKRNVDNEREKRYLNFFEISQDLQDNHSTPSATRCCRAFFTSR